MRPIPEQLRLNEYVFDSIHVKANYNHTSDSDEEAGDIEEYEGLTIRVQHFLHKEKHNIFQSKVELELLEGDEAKAPYFFTLTVRGVFEVLDEDADNERRQTFFHNLAPSILYSAAREFLISITSRCPFGQVMLPLMTFPLQPSKFIAPKTSSSEDKEGEESKDKKRISKKNKKPSEERKDNTM